MKLLIFPSSFQTWQGVGVGYGQGQEGGQTEHYFSFLLQTVGHYSIFKLNKIWSFEPKDIYPLPPANFLVTLPPPDFGIFLCILILVIILKNFCIDETTFLWLPPLQCVNALHLHSRVMMTPLITQKLLHHGNHQFQYHILWTALPMLPTFLFSNSHYFYSDHMETHSPFLAHNIVPITQKIHKL